MSSLPSVNVNAVNKIYLGHNASGNATSHLIETEDSNESTESNVVLGFRGFGSVSPNPNSYGQSGSGSASPCVWDPNERVKNSLSAIKLMCESPALDPYLLQLLSEK